MAYGSSINEIINLWRIYLWGEVIDIPPTGPREVVGGKLAIKLGIAITHA